jgi:hypothetical protein
MGRGLSQFKANRSDDHVWFASIYPSDVFDVQDVKEETPLTRNASISNGSVSAIPLLCLFLANWCATDFEAFPYVVFVKSANTGNRDGILP